MEKYTDDYLFNLILQTGKRENKYLGKTYKRAFRMLPKRSRHLLGKILEAKEIRFYRDSDCYVQIDNVRCVNKSKKLRPCVYMSNRAGSQTVFHELGHAIDYLLGGDSLATSTHHLESVQNTFYFAANAELKANHQAIYEHIMNEFKSVVVKGVGLEKYNNVLKHNKLHNEFCMLDQLIREQKIKDAAELETKMKRRDQLMRWFDKHGYIEDFIDIILLNSAYKFNLQNYPLIDAVGAYHDLSLLGFVHHSKEYWGSSENISAEIFANLFSAKMLDETLTLDTFEKFMPQTYEAFNELYSIILHRFLQLKKKPTNSYMSTGNLMGEQQCNLTNI